MAETTLPDGQKAQIVETPQVSPVSAEKLTLEELSKQFSAYLPYLEALRNGNKTFGKLTRASAQSLFTGANIIQFDTKYAAEGVTADIANNQFTIQTPGYYSINAMISVDAPPAGMFLRLIIAINGITKTTQFLQSNAATTLSYQVQDLIKLNPRDTVSISFNNSSGGTLNLVGNANYNIFNIIKL